MWPSKPTWVSTCTKSESVSHSVMPDSAAPCTVAWWASVHGFLQARTLEWVPSSRGSSQSRDRTQVSLIAGRFLTVLMGDTQEKWVTLRGGIKFRVKCYLSRKGWGRCRSLMAGSVTSRRDERTLRTHWRYDSLWWSCLSVVLTSTLLLGWIHLPWLMN